MGNHVGGLGGVRKHLQLMGGTHQAPP